MKNIASLLICVCLFIACKKAPDYPDTPIIEFRDLKQEFIKSPTGDRDSVVITIGFKDGDGDIGYDDEDLANPIYKDSFNYKATLYKKIGGQFTEYVFGGVTYNGQLPRFAPRGAKGPLDGTISRHFNFNHFGFPQVDTFKFRISITDRAFHQSNVIETPEFILFRKQ